MLVLKKCMRVCILGVQGVVLCSTPFLQRLCCSLVSPRNVCIPLQFGSARQTAVPRLAARTQLSRNKPSRWEMWPDCRYHIQLLGWEAPRE